MNIDRLFARIAELRKAAARNRKNANDALSVCSSILDAVPHAVIMLKDRIITYANHGVTAVFGWRPEELQGRNARLLYRSDEEYRRIADLFYPVLATQRTHRMEFPCRRKDGRDLMCMVGASRIGETLRDRMIVVTFQDITEQRQNERVFKHASSYNRGLIEVSPDPLVTIGFDGKITDVNAATEKVTGYSRNSLIGTDFCGYFTDPAKAKEGYRAAFRDGSVRDVALEILHRNGRTTPVLYNATVFRDEWGTIVGVFATARDISLRKKMEQALREANELLEKRIDQRTRELSEKTRRLEEVNAALKTLLRQRDEDKADFEENILENVAVLILPYVEKLRKSRPTDEQAACLEILESHIKEITSPFARKLSQRLSHLTPTEIRVADLIRQGRTTKEIAQILLTSPNTILFHRFNLRSKLNIRGKQMNLRSYLLAHQD